MEFFTALVIYYTLDTNNVQFVDKEQTAIIWFETKKGCQDAIRHQDFFGLIYENILDTHISCMESKILSKSIKPRLRP